MRLVHAAALALVAATMAASCSADPGDGQSLFGGVAPSRIEVCHFAPESGSFVYLTVLPDELATHISHGDGRVGHLVPGRADMRLGQDCAAVQLQSVTISLNGLTVGNPVQTYTEAGFTLTAKSGPWVSYWFGRPAPAFVFYAATPTTAQIDVTAAGSLFLFSAIDLFSSVTTIPHVITGTIASTSIYSVAGTVPNTFGHFATVTNSNPPVMIDALSIVITNPMSLAQCCPSCCVPNPSGFDNLVLKR